MSNPATAEHHRGRGGHKKVDIGNVLLRELCISTTSLWLFLLGGIAIKS